MKRERITSLELKNLTLQFDKLPPLFKDLQLSVSLGQDIVIKGGPGSGKSILLRLMAGLIEPTAGEVIYNGKSLNNFTLEEFAPLRTSTAFCFDNGGLLMNKTLTDNIKLPLLYNHQWRAERSQDLFDGLVNSFKIREFLNHRPSAVSSGVRKIAGMVRVFLCTPQILFFDEPTLGIGEQAVGVFKQWVEKFKVHEKKDESLIVTSSDSSFISGFQGAHYEIKESVLAA